MVATSSMATTSAAFAQAKNPFSVGISEGGGTASGVTGWLLSQQAWFEHRLSVSVRLLHADATAVWPLVALSLLYGIFHAAGPGHGKAVLSSYMVANERALRRGVALSLLAALLQGAVAVVLVGVLALLLHATAEHMKATASLAEQISFAGVATLGLWLVWRKGRSFVRHLRSYTVTGMSTGGAGFLGWPSRAASAMPGLAAYEFGDGLALAGRPSQFECVAVDATHDATCVHCHSVDPVGLDRDGFSIKEAALTVLAAGARPCSGAILVLVFALAQGVFWAGILSVLAMSLGVAVTTAALASVAVLGKSLARRLSSPGSRRAGLLFSGLELAAACAVLIVGIALLLGSRPLGGA